jgi:hypothetical protein
MPTAKTRLRLLVDHVVDFATETFRERGEVAPMWIAETKTGQRIPVMTPMDTSEQKDMVAKGLRRLFKAQGVVRYAFMSESWMVDVRGREDLPGLTPSKHPDRREILMVSAADNTLGDGGFEPHRRGNFFWIHVVKQCRPEGPAKGPTQSYS